MLLLLAKEMENKNRPWDSFEKLNLLIVYPSKPEQKVTKMA